MGKVKKSQSINHYRGRSGQIFRSKKIGHRAEELRNNHYFKLAGPIPDCSFLNQKLLLMPSLLVLVLLMVFISLIT